MKRLTVILVLILAGILLTAAMLQPSNSYFKEDRTIKKELSVKPGGKLRLDLKVGGSIEIEGWNRETVLVEADIKGRRSDEIEFNIDQNGNNVEIESYYDSWGSNSRANINVTIMIPEKYDVYFSTMGGGIKIKNVNGELEGKTMGGELNLSNLKGEVDMITMGGKVFVRDCEVNGKVKTMGGEVFVENVTGNLNASSMGGKVIQKNFKGKKNSVVSEVNISTMGGRIDVDEAPNGVKVKTMGGDITVNSATKFVDAVTYGGDIEIKEVDGKVEAKTFGGDIEVKMIGVGNDDGKDVELTSLGGDITLTVPKDFSMDVYIEIAYTKGGKKNYRKFEDVKVEGDFKLTEKRDDEWDYSNGSPRKYYYGKGIFNGGKNKVVLKTINGIVTLKKS